MSDTERVRAWRQRLKDGGLVPMTIWVKAETKARYEDLALQSHRSGSEIAQLALEAYRLDPAALAAPVPDTAQLRTLIREELDEAMAIITANITAIVTDTARATLPALVETALQRSVSDTVTETETATPQEPRGLTTVEAFVADMATDTDTDTAGSTLPQESSAPYVADTVADTETETPQASRIAASGETPVADTATATETDTARTPRGVRRLTPLQAAELRDKRAGGVPVKTLMEEYGLSRATVHRYLTAPPGL